MVAYRTGQTLGLPIGGFLAHPERQWPRFFDNEFWQRYPYALPCFVGAGIAFFAVFCGMIFVKEVRSPVLDPLTPSQFSGLHDSYY